MKNREWILLGAYTALIVSLSFFHEMWRDEVRAWTVATDATSWRAMFAELKYEGHPALWYIILRTGHLLTHSRLILPVSAIIIAIGAAWVILRFAPFPEWLKALTIFGAFLGYELSVSARNYGIGVLLMVSACSAYPARARKPFWFAIMLALLANTSVHGAIAAAGIAGFWLLESWSQRTSTRQSIAVIAIVVAGIIIGLLTARPSPNMVFAASLADLDASKILHSILIDPGKGLMGFMDANIAAVSEYPWRFVPVNPTVASRLIVDACLVWLLWNLRSSWKTIIILIVTIIAFEIVFRSIYTASLRHEGILLFLIFSICWLAVITADVDRMELVRTRMVLGLAPLFVLQAIALPVLVNRGIAHQQSSSKHFGQFIRLNPQYENAILVGEPDYLMESMPYYAGNRIYMARQRQFARRVYFGDDSRRQRNMSLSQLQEMAAQLSCRYEVPVLVAIGAKEFPDRLQGSADVAYRSTFTWTAAEKARFTAEFPRVAWFERANTDEVYQVFEAPRCGAPPG